MSSIAAAGMIFEQLKKKQQVAKSSVFFLMFAKSITLDLLWWLEDFNSYPLDMVAMLIFRGRGIPPKSLTVRP